MFEFIKIHDIKRINKEGVLLSGLGKINIVCGKNNSGKTSLLEGINLKEKSEEGRKLKTRDIDIIFNAALLGAGWSPKGPNGPEAKRRSQPNV